MLLNINSILLKTLSDRLGRSANKLELAPRIKTIGGKIPDLSDSERKSILEIWDHISAGTVNFDYWRFYKAMGINNPMLVPDNIYWSKIIRSLNPTSLTRTYINKSLYPIIFKGLRQPKVLVNVINGEPYDGKMERLTLAEAIDILHAHENDVIIKPTTATSGGCGIQKISSDANKEDVKHILSRYGRNYICQDVVQQSKSTAVFNETSLNTFRVNTININGRTTCECLMMRHGLSGSVVDNFAVGGVVLGMTKDGKFNGNNYNTGLDSLTCTQDGTPYQDLTIQNISEVLHTAVEAHQRFMPHIGHAAWDFAIDANNLPVMIEVNLMLPGILMEQLTSHDSIFGRRTEEVIQYAMMRNKTMRWTEYVGGWQ